MYHRFAAFLFLNLFAAVFFAGTASAARVEDMKGVPDRNDFDFGPTSFDIMLSPGETITKTLQVTNRTGEDTDFIVEVEDFEGSSNPSQTVVLQGKGVGRYSAKDWIKPEMNRFTLKHGQRQFFDVAIEVPRLSVDAGDHYASVLVKTVPKKAPAENAHNVILTSRVGSLLFLRMPGDIVEKGELTSFDAPRFVTEKKPVDLNAIFENSGTVRLAPFGSIEVKDAFGRVVRRMDVSPFNVLRASTRSHIEQWLPGNLPGRYMATIQLHRGYGNETDVSVVRFWYFPLKEIAISFGVLALFFFVVWWLRRRVSFEVKLKK